MHTMWLKEKGNELEEIIKEIEVTPQTNADRIRSMSDEELAEVIPVIFDCCCNPTVECMQYATEHGECIKTTECVLKWLKSEVKE